MFKDLTEKELARVDKLVEEHDFSIAEAVDIVKADREIDQGKRVEFDLSPEEERAAKKYANSTEKKKTVRKRAEDAVKRNFIAEIAQFLGENYNNLSNLEIVNPERVVSFEFDGEKYEIILQKKRKPKIQGHFCPQKGKIWGVL